MDISKSGQSGGLRPLTGLVIGAGAFGAMLGAWIALSSSPIVTAALPLIFAIAGGVTSTMIAKLDLTKENNREKLNLLGASMAAFCIFCIVSMLGLLLARPLLMTHLAAKQQRVDVSTHADPLNALLMRVRLEALGASDAEMRAIMAKPIPANQFQLDEALRSIAGRPRESPPRAIGHWDSGLQPG